MIGWCALLVGIVMLVGAELRRQAYWRGYLQSKRRRP